MNKRYVLNYSKSYGSCAEPDNPGLFSILMPVFIWSFKSVIKRLNTFIYQGVQAFLFCCPFINKASKAYIIYFVAIIYDI